MAEEVERLRASIERGVVLKGVDGCLRDLAGLRGSYHLVDETPAAIDAVGGCLAELAPEQCHFLFDAPVSNSGRLRALLAERASHWSFSVQTELVADPDPVLAGLSGVASSDGMILDRCGAWANVTSWAVARSAPTAWVVDLGAIGEAG